MANRRSPSGPAPGSSVEQQSASDGSLSNEATSAEGDLASSPLALAVGFEVVRRYEAGLARLGRRDREAVRGRIEKLRSYDELAVALGVSTPGAARAVVIRALGRLLKVMSE